jgi:hypothetical protein
MRTIKAIIFIIVSPIRMPTELRRAPLRTETGYQDRAKFTWVKGPGFLQHLAHQSG